MIHNNYYYYEKAAHSKNHDFKQVVVSGSVSAKNRYRYIDMYGMQNNIATVPLRVLAP